VRVALTTALGYFFALPFPRMMGLDPRWGVAGLTASAGFAAWIEFLLLRRGMAQRIGPVESSRAFFAKLWGCALVAAAVAWGIRLGLQPRRPLISAALILVPYVLVYFALTASVGINEASALVGRLRRRIG
jgi:putative peptidoglycan lipid II flippase